MLQVVKARLWSQIEILFSQGHESWHNTACTSNLLVCCDPHSQKDGRYLKRWEYQTTSSASWEIFTPV